MARRFQLPFLAYQHPIEGGQSATALPRCSNVDLLGDGERVIDLDSGYLTFRSKTA
jgi:hypothetical protein